MTQGVQLERQSRSLTRDGLEGLTSSRRNALKIVPLGLLAALSGGSYACRSTAEASGVHARLHAQGLVTMVDRDLAQVRGGLPLGAANIARNWPKLGEAFPDVNEARDLLRRSRSKTRQLRVAKSTFFVLADTQGEVVRSDQTPDQLAGGSLFEHFPALRSVLSDARVVETRGEWALANTVRGIPDGQWIAAQRVGRDGPVLGIYATGWSWAAYAHRLEFSLRSELTSRARQGRGKLPLVYVYLSVAGRIYGGAQAPRVTAEAIAAIPISKALSQTPDWKAQLEVTGRNFGVGAAAVPGLGQDVFAFVVRSET